MSSASSRAATSTPSSRACAAAVSIEITTSPSTRARRAVIATGSGTPGDASSVRANASTSVGRSRFRYAAFSARISASSTSARLSSSCPRPKRRRICVPRTRTWRVHARAAGARHATVTPMAIERARRRPSRRSGSAPFAAAFRALVRGDDVLHEPVANDVALAEAHELDPGDVAQNVLRLFETGKLAGRQIDLRHVAGNDRLRPVSEARQKHLHLLRRRVLRLVEDDEGVVQRVVREEEVVRHIERILRCDTDADAILLADRLDRVYITHGPAAPARLDVCVAFPGETERPHPGTEANLDRGCIVPLLHVAATRAS